MTTTVRIKQQEKITVRPQVTDTITVRIKAIGPQGAIGGSGVFLDKATYDPNDVAADVFDMDNMVSGTTNVVFTAVEQAKLGTIEQNATADQTGAEIKTLYESQLDTNAFTDAEKSKLSGIENGATADQTASEFNHDDLSNISGTAGEYNHPNDADMAILHSISGTNTGDQVASDFNHDDLSNISGTPGEYNHPTDAQMAVLGNTSGTNTGDQTITLTGDATGSGTGSIAVSVDRVTRKVRNETGSTIAAGRAVYISGFNNYPLVSLANNTLDAAHHAIGVTTASIANAANGTIVVTGIIAGIDTNSYSAVGAKLYLGTSGQLVEGEPTSGEVIFLGEVLVKENNGSILLYEVKGIDYVASAAGEDIPVKMGDNDGVNKVSFKDYANNEVASIDSDGVISGANLSGTNTGDQSSSDFNHDDLSGLTGTPGEYNHPSDAQMTVLGNTSGTNTGDQNASEVGITDSGDYFVGTSVEDALQELGLAASGGSGVTESDVVALVIALG